LGCSAWPSRENAKQDFPDMITLDMLHWHYQITRAHC
jgi:hypothetical protein